MVTTSKPVAHQRTQWLVWLAYADDEAYERNEEDSDSDQHHGQSQTLRLDLCGLVFVLCLSRNKPQLVDLVCCAYSSSLIIILADILCKSISQFSYMISFPTFKCGGKCHLISLCNTLLITTILSNVHRNLIGECNDHINNPYSCTWFIFLCQTFHGYRRHVTLIPFEFCPSLLICYHSNNSISPIHRQAILL